MYSSSVSHTKTVGSVLYAVVAAVSGILALWCMINVNILVGLVILALLVAVSYSQHMFFAAFGDLSMETATAKKAYEELLASTKKKSQQSVPTVLQVKRNASSPAFDAPKTYPTVAPISAEVGMVTCPCCGLKQYANRTRCFDCGAFFHKN